MANQILVCVEGDSVAVGCSSDNVLSGTDSPLIKGVRGTPIDIQCNGKTIRITVPLAQSAQFANYIELVDDGSGNLIEDPNTSSQHVFLVPDEDLQCKTSAFE